MNESTIIDLLPGQPDGRNTDHICLVIEPTDLHELAKRTGAQRRGGTRPTRRRAGTGWSIYVIDPDGHVIELKQYGTDAGGLPTPQQPPP